MSKKSKKNQPKSNIYSFRKTRRREFLFEELKNIEPFSNHFQESKILDFLLESAYEHPDRFKATSIDQQVDLFGLIEKVNQMQIEFQKNNRDMILEVYKKVEDLEIKFEKVVNVFKTKNIPSPFDEIEFGDKRGDT